MIRALEEKDIEMVCSIVDENWNTVYKEYINPLLLDAAGCEKRKCELKADFISQRLLEYVWEEQNQVSAMLSIGDTVDTDKNGAFEIWRIYVAIKFQSKGIGNRLLDFAEQQAKIRGHKEIIIWAFKDNIHAISFYQMHGYHIDKEEYLGEMYQTIGVRLTKKLEVVTSSLAPQSSMS